MTGAGERARIAARGIDDVDRIRADRNSHLSPGKLDHAPRSIEGIDLRIAGARQDGGPATGRPDDIDLAIVAREPEADVFKEQMERADGLLIGIPTVLELRMVLAGRAGSAQADIMINAMLTSNILRIDFNQDHLREAIVAFDHYGKGRHPAALNFGDCMAYAVAKVAGCPLLYKGADFASTDIRSALEA